MLNENSVLGHFKQKLLIAIHEDFNETLLSLENFNTTEKT
jgi:hypothetical protein